MVMVMVMTTAAAFATPAGLCLAEYRATTGDKELDRFSHRGSPFIGADLDTDLLEAGERAPTHAAGKKNLHAPLFEKGHGRHAGALGVPGVFKDGNLSDGVISHVDQGKGRTVAEVLRNGGLEAVGGVRGNCDQHTSLLSRGSDGNRLSSGCPH